MNNKEKFYNMLKNFRKGENGGNPNAKLWFCGIENMAYGTPQKEHNLNLLNIPEYTKLSGQDLTGSFNKKIKYILEHLGLIDSNISADDMYKSNNFYCTNLFPFAFYDAKDCDTKYLYELTGLNTRQEYEEACLSARTNNNEWQEFKKNANVIICFGKPNWTQFLEIFCTSEFDKGKNKLSLQSSKHNKVLINLNNGQTIILCSHPRYCEDWSNQETDKLIKEIKKLLAQ